MRSKLNHIFLVLLLAMLPLIAIAQAKPKRDTSKDKPLQPVARPTPKAVVKSIQEPIKSAKSQHRSHMKMTRPELIAKQNISKKSRRRTTQTIRYNRKRYNKSAPFLYINGEDYANIYIDHNSFVTDFYVSTSGNDWEITDENCNWLYTNRIGNSHFRIYVSANDSGQERQTHFYVKSDGLYRLVTISQQGRYTTPTAEFYTATLQHEVEYNNAKYMLLYVWAYVSDAGESNLRACASLDFSEANFYSSPTYIVDGEKRMYRFLVYIPYYTLEKYCWNGMQTLHLSLIFERDKAYTQEVKLNHTISFRTKIKRKDLVTSND